MLLYSSVEIGQRLTEAKSVVNHGEWGKWLENSVSYSQSTANKLMRLYEEYGAKLTAGQDGGNSESIPNLSYTQAIILLRIPEEERESFVVENDAAGMSTRELKQAVKERDLALNEKEELQNALTANQGAVTEITFERDELRKQASGLQASIRTKELTIKTLQEKLAAAKGDKVSAGTVAALEKDIKAAQVKLTAGKVSFLYNNIADEFEELLNELTKLAPADPEVHEKYKGEVSGLIGKIGERL